MRVFLFLALLSSSAFADVYRCTVAGKTVYQDSPCPNARLVANSNALSPSRADYQTALDRVAKERDFVARQAQARSVQGSIVTLTQQVIPGPLPGSSGRVDRYNFPRR